MSGDAPMRGPLTGKRIVLTRAIEQARELKARLEQAGATVLLFPAVSFSEPTDTTELDRAIHSLAEFDWILFTSANAARFFALRCRKLGIAPSDDVTCRCAAVGPATASAVAAEGFTVHHVAQEFLGIALARELGALLKGKKILLPRSARARPDLPEALTQSGAYVTEVVGYHTGGVGTVEPAVISAVRGGDVDAISFFSPSAVENIATEIGSESLLRLVDRAAFAAVGPATAAALRAAGLPVTIQARAATAESMAAAICKYFLAGTPSQAGNL